MKYQQIFSSFLLLTLLTLCSSSVYASEVTGSLRGGSPAATTPSSGGGSEGGNGSIGGSVQNTTPSSSGSTNGRSSAGSVLGASTGPSSVSSDGTALQPSRGLAIDYATSSTVSGDATTLSPQPTDDTMPSNSYADTTAAVGGLSTFSVATWFWIILLIVLLVGAIIYIYNRNNAPNSTRLHS